MAKTPNLSHGRDYLAIPGPSVMPDAVLRAMHRGAPNIYAGELIDIAIQMILRAQKLTPNERQFSEREILDFSKSNQFFNISLVMCIYIETI